MIPIAKPMIGEEEKQAVLEVLDSGMIAQGERVKAFEEAFAAMCGVKDVTYKPDPESHRIYQKIYELYRQLHDSFGLADHQSCLGNVMKQLLEIKEGVNS